MSIKKKLKKTKIVQFTASTCNYLLHQTMRDAKHVSSVTLCEYCIHYDYALIRAVEVASKET